MGLEVYKAGELNYEDYKQLTIEAKEDVQSIRQEVYDELASDNDLGLLNSPSRTSRWNLVADVVAFISWLLHGTWIRYEKRLKEAAAKAIPHTAFWYATKAKEFQLGDTLDATDGTVVYPVIDPTKQIVKAASVKEVLSGNLSLLIIKVAKESGAQLVALSNAELLAFEGYINTIKDAGVVTQAISQNADLLKLEQDIYYNPIIPLATIRAAVDAAILAYIQNLPFDGVFRVISLEDAIQSVTGVIDINTKVCEISTNYNTNPNFQAVEVFYETFAGYLNIDPNYPLSSQLNFIPYN